MKLRQGFAYPQRAGSLSQAQVASERDFQDWSNVGVPSPSENAECEDAFDRRKTDFEITAWRLETSLGEADRRRRVK
jgi:hypothetical protein